MDFEYEGEGEAHGEGHVDGGTEGDGRQGVEKVHIHLEKGGERGVLFKWSCWIDFIY